MNQRSYLDYNATSPLRDEVRDGCDRCAVADGNPSSVHEEGRAARAAIEAARAKVAKLAGARPEDVIFTSGGTEANALALAAQGGRGLALLSCRRSSILRCSRAAGSIRETMTHIPVTPTA